MSFRKLLLLFQICSFGYFVFANPELCAKLIHEGPAAVKVVAANPRLAFKVLMGQVPSAELKPSEPKAKAESGNTEKTPQMAEGAPSVSPVSTTATAPVATPALEAAQLIAKIPTEAPAAMNALPPGFSASINQSATAKQLKMSDYDKKLQVAYEMSESEGAASSKNNAASAEPVAVPQKTVVFEVERNEISTRFLHLIVGTSTLRFHIANNMTDKEMGLIAESLKNACLKQLATEMCARNQSTVLVDRRFFVDVKETEVAEWASSLVPATGLVWHLTCANGRDECLKTASRTRAFKLSLTRANENEVTLARGFETRAQSAAIRKISARLPAAANARSVSRAYVTRAVNARTSLNNAGSL